MNKHRKWRIAVRNGKFLIMTPDRGIVKFTASSIAVGMNAIERVERNGLLNRLKAM